MQVNVGDKVIYSKYAGNRRGTGQRRVHYRKTERYSRNRNRVKIVRRQMITGKNKEMFNDGKGNQIRI